MKRPLGWVPMGMLVVVLAAAAVAVLHDREQLPEGSVRRFNIAADGRFAAATRAAVRQVRRFGADATAALIVLTVGMGALAIPRRRVPRRSWPGRGRAALIAANLGITWGVINHLVLLLETPAIFTAVRSSGHLLTHATRAIGSHPPAWVVGAWACLAYAGRWSGRGDPPDAPERARRLVGWAWLVLLVGSWFDRVIP